MLPTDNPQYRVAPKQSNDCYASNLWILEEKPVGEVMTANERVAHVLGLNPKRFPRWDNTLQRDLKKMHGTWKMATIQHLRHGNGQGWDSSHTERMHQYFLLVSEHRHNDGLPPLRIMWQIACTKLPQLMHASINLKLC